MNNIKPVMHYVARYVGLIVLGILTITGVYITWSYILPKYQEIQTLQIEIESLTKERDDLTKYVAYLRELETTTLPFEEELVNYALPSENDVISLIVTYEGLGKTPDMTVSPFDLAPGLIKTETTGLGDGASTNSSPTGGAPGETGTESRELEFHMDAKTEKPEVALDFIGKIHKARRIFSIKSLTWQNPDKEQTDSEDANKILLTFELGTYYYPSAPTVVGSAELVKKGQLQGNFIAQLSSTTIYDALVLDTVEVGKEDLFTLGETQVTPAPLPNPTPEQIQESTPSATVTQPEVF